MSFDIFTPIDLHQNEIENVRLDNLAVAPLAPVVGQIYFDTLLGFARIWDGSAWQIASASSALKFATNVGDGLSLIFILNHNLNTKDFLVSIFDNTTFNEVLAVVNHTTVNTATITFSAIPLLNQYRVTILA